MYVYLDLKSQAGYLEIMKYYLWLTNNQKAWAADGQYNPENLMS